eukprot:GHVU01026363.1.p1 GENE.GHVU01026363.1~~GHVU01026363.1.p1  ORF type:complete len:281 (-),score=54.84 GHVU01026363.1:639-1481(-)
MTKHSKNNTANAVFTYHEKKLMTDVGTQRQRLGSDNMRKFDHCWLCLRSAVKPVCTVDGFIYCRDCIVLNLVEQKTKMTEMKVLWDAEENKKQREEAEKTATSKTVEVAKFLESEERVAPREHVKVKTTIQKKSQSATTTELPGKEERRKKNFWIVENEPHSVSRRVLPPPKQLVCPMTKKPLKIKELIDVVPETTNDDTEFATWVCEVSKKPLNHKKAVLIKPTGQLVLEELVPDYVLCEGGVAGSGIKAEDLVPVLPGGSGFCSHNKVEATTFRAMYH